MTPQHRALLPGLSDDDQKGYAMSTRRTFLKQMALAAGATPLFLSARARAADNYSDLRIAFIATGGIAGAHIGEMTRLGITCPCYCDVDENAWGNARDKWPKATAYRDYRVMLEREAKNIDGVMIGTPDHHHYPATMIAMELGLHTYTQKPLTHTPWESRRLVRMARENPKLATQMGNQGHASDAWRQLYNFIHAGGIGTVREVHTWTDRALNWWPQGQTRLPGEDPIPANLSWDLWLGAAPARPYKNQYPEGLPWKGNVYQPFVWRGWRDFGTGALGDMGCHMMDGTAWTMDPGFPTSIEPLMVEGLTSEAYPTHAKVKWNFPARHGRPAFSQFWYESGLKPEKPEGVTGEWNLPSNGSVWIGSEGVLLYESSGGPISTFPSNLLKDAGEVPELLKKCPNQDHYAEWLNAIRGTDTTKSNFIYAGGLAEFVLLGNIAMIMGHKLEYDGENMRFPGCPEADQYLTKEYRPGWAFGLDKPKAKAGGGSGLPADHPLVRRGAAR
jgi:predicted dehydrogenase